jgi:tetratricopeptide (TPR) repeat protein
VAAIDRQIELSPSDPDVLDAAGNTYATLREHDRAIAVLQRAIEIAPNFTASRCVLFDLLAEHQRWDEAAEAVTNLARMDDHPAVIARRMEVAGARGDEATRQQALREILSQVPENRWALNKAVHIERAHRSATSLADQLREQIEQWIDAYGDAAEQTDDGHTASREDYETAMFAVAGHWVEQIFGLPRLRFSKQIRLAEQQANAWFADARPGGEPAGRSVLANLLRQVGSQPRVRLFHALRRRNGDRIVRDPHLWSMVAYLLADRPRRFSRRLLRQWSRAGEGLRLKPWMKTNAQELLRLTGQTERARAMVRDTVDSPADHMFSQLALWAAHDALVAGDDRAALQYFLKAARLEDLEGNDRLLHLWVEAGLQMRQADDKEAAFAQVRSRLDEHQPAFGFLRDQPLYAGMLARTVGLAVSAAGTFAARRWGYRKRLLLAWAALSRV